MTLKAFGIATLVAVSLAVGPGISFAHHAFSAEFDQSKPVKISGEITKLQWVNPHAWIFIDAKGADGKVVPWRFEMGAPNALLRAGWSKSDIKVGTPVTISGFMARAGGEVGNAFQVRLPDGRDLFAASSIKDAAAGK
jgi:sarcosine oxidase gamma subunit